jgi:hypothetical protein
MACGLVHQCACQNGSFTPRSDLNLHFTIRQIIWSISLLNLSAIVVPLSNSHYDATIQVCASASVTLTYDLIGLDH